jgi:hypothetical protein
MGRPGGSLTETPLPADLYQNAKLRIVRGELLLFPPRPPRPIKIVRVSPVPAATMRLSPGWDLMTDEAGNIAMLSGEAAIAQDAESERRQFEAEASQAAAAVDAIQARSRTTESPPAVVPEPAPPMPARTGSPGRPAAKSSTPAGFRTTSAVKAEEACKNYIAALKERPQNKETAFAEAVEAVKSIGPLSRKAFERAWHDMAPIEWLNAGRRRKSR